MSLYLRLVVGSIVVCDVELFGTVAKPSDNEPPAQLAGGSGTVLYPEPVADDAHFGF